MMQTELFVLHNNKRWHLKNAFSAIWVIESNQQESQSTSTPQSEEVTLELTALYTLDGGVLSSLPYNSILWQRDMRTFHN